MHLANQSSGKPDTCYPRVHQARQAIPEFNGGNPRYKGSAQRVREIDQPDKQRTRATGERRQSSEVIQPAQEARGMLGQETLDYPHCRKLGLRHKA